ncbi:MAG TPA: DsrE family protein [Gammaproteobacteria bacterium]|jgi:intracellular sulfur oxidation DsrE/DsrF family protein
MRRYTHLILGLLAAAILSLPAQADDSMQNPVIKSGGAVHPLPDAALQPDRNQTYKALFSVTKGASDPKDLNDALDHVARAVNVFASAGVPLDHLKFAVVVHGPATPLVLDGASYQKHFGTDNPNLKLIHELKAAGVQIYVCGQALAGMKYQASEVNPDVKVALSALSTIVILQQQGYALMPM